MSKRHKYVTQRKHSGWHEKTNVTLDDRKVSPPALPSLFPPLSHTHLFLTNPMEKTLKIDLKKNNSRQLMFGVAEDVGNGHSYTAGLSVSFWKVTSQY